MTTNYERGWYLVEHDDGDIRVRQIRDGGWCLGPDDISPSSLSGMKVIRRIADLSGKPVVDERVIEAIREEYFTSRSLTRKNLEVILRKHLDMERKATQQPSKPTADAEHRANNLANAYSDQTQRLNRLIEERDRLQARVAELEAAPTISKYRENATGDEWLFLPEDQFGERRGQSVSGTKQITCTNTYFAANFTALPANADAPIVNLPGAEVWWDHQGKQWTCWKVGTRFSLMSHVDGSVCTFYEHERDHLFTRQRPTALPPEQEKLVQPIADWAKRTPEEARAFLAKQGAAT